MWPFKRKRRPPRPDSGIRRNDGKSDHLIGNAVWRPSYLDERKFPGAMVEWSPKLQRDASGLMPHQPARFTMWGDLEKEQCALRGLEAVAGMVSTRHKACGHFWCDDTSRTIVAELYHNRLGPTADYIGVFLWAVVDVKDDSDGDGFRFFGQDRPTQKLVIQPLDDGSVFIRKGFITHIPGVISAAGQGHLDSDTAENLRVYPRQVHNIIADSSDQWPTFSLYREESGWHIGRCFGGVDNEWYSTPGFAHLPI